MMVSLYLRKWLKTRLQKFLPAFAWNKGFNFQFQFYSVTNQPSDWPLSSPTNYATIIPDTVELFTTQAMSAKLETGVRLNACLNKPKHQSGANFV